MSKRSDRKEALAAAAAVDGLLGFDVDSDIQQFDHGIERPKTTTFQVEGLGTATMVSGKSSGDGEPFNGGTVDAFYAVVRDDAPGGTGRPIAYVRAGVLRPKDEIIAFGSNRFKRYLTDLADQSWHVHPERVSQVRRSLGDIAEAFADGAMVMVDDLSRDLAVTPEGSGAKLLQGALANYSAVRRVRIGSVAYTPAAKQYDGVPGMIHKSVFKEASRALRATIDAAIATTPVQHGAKAPRPIAWRQANPAQGYDPGLVELAGLQADQDPRYREDGQRDRAIRLTSVVMKMLRIDPKTLKMKSGPPPLQPDDFPPGFDVRVAATFPSLDPRREIWDHLHPDVVAVTVLPTGRWEEGVDGFGRPGPNGRPGRPELIMKVEFANATEIDMPSDHMLWGRRMFNILPEFMEECGSIVLESPFTPGYKTMTVNDTLSVNLAMLFSSDPHAIEEIEETRYERPTT